MCFCGDINIWYSYYELIHYLNSQLRICLFQSDKVSRDGCTIKHWSHWLKDCCLAVKPSMWHSLWHPFWLGVGIHYLWMKVAWAPKIFWWDLFWPKNHIRWENLGFLSNTINNLGSCGHFLKKKIGWVVLEKISKEVQKSNVFFLFKTASITEQNENKIFEKGAL